MKRNGVSAIALIVGIICIRASSYGFEGFAGEINPNVGLTRDGFKVTYENSFKNKHYQNSYYTNGALKEEMREFAVTKEYLNGISRWVWPHRENAWGIFKLGKPFGVSIVEERNGNLNLSFPSNRSVRLNFSDAPSNRMREKGFAFLDAYVDHLELVCLFTKNGNLFLCAFDASNGEEKSCVKIGKASYGSHQRPFVSNIEKANGKYFVSWIEKQKLYLSAWQPQKEKKITCKMIVKEMGLSLGLSMRANGNELLIAWSHADEFAGHAIIRTICTNVE